MVFCYLCQQIAFPHLKSHIQTSNMSQRLRSNYKCYPSDKKPSQILPTSFNLMDLK